LDEKWQIAEGARVRKTHVSKTYVGYIPLIFDHGFKKKGLRRVDQPVFSGPKITKNRPFGINESHHPFIFNTP